MVSSTIAGLEKHDSPLTALRSTVTRRPYDLSRLPSVVQRREMAYSCSESITTTIDGNTFIQSHKEDVAANRSHFTSVVPDVESG